MITTDFLRHLDKLSLIIRKRITSDYVGERPTQHVGRGLVFKDYVMYAPGDDIRSVDWKIFARSDKLFAKRYEEERNLTVHVVLDYSASMNYASGKTKKGDYAAELALGFCYMALKNNERFVLGTFSDTLQLFPPRRGRKQLMLLLDHLNKTEPSGKSNFEQSIVRYRALVNTKSFVVIISDFLYPIDEIRRTILRFRRHDLVLCQVLDPLEVNLKIEGDYKLKDAESGFSLRTFISGALRKVYKTRMEDHQAMIRKACEEVGGRFLTFNTDQEIFDAFSEILQHSVHEHK